jgi:hypothetical protein
MPWGAYYIGALFLKAASLDPNLSDDEQAVIDAQIVDFFNRSSVPKADVEAKKFGEPPMESGGLKD